MTSEQGGSTHLEEIDLGISQWRQGDCVVGEQTFTHAFDPMVPITEAAKAAATAGFALVDTFVAGLAVLTQTCDLVRSCKVRHYVEVAPLVLAESGLVEEVRRGRRPNYAYLTGIADHGLIVDLDRVMTVEKALVVTWSRVQGCRTDDETRQFADALARKRSRFAFPDDFTLLVDGLRERLNEKHGKQSPEGEALRGIREIRVRAHPSWDADAIELEFIFIRGSDGGDASGIPDYEFLKKWLDLVPATGRFVTVDGVIHTPERMTADEYVRSDRLDLDHLSKFTRVAADPPST